MYKLCPSHERGCCCSTLLRVIARIEQKHLTNQPLIGLCRLSEFCAYLKKYIYFNGIRIIGAIHLRIVAS